MTESLFSIAYFSRSNIGPDPVDQAREISQIVTAARRNNLLVGVTGALLYSNGCFAQVLEGARADVELVLDRVRTDPRHRDVRVVQSGAVEYRNFGDWWMAYAGETPEGQDAPKQPEGIYDPQDILTSHSGRQLLARLRELVTQDDLDHGAPATAGAGNATLLNSSST